MKTLYLECNMGAAGDMLMAALLELHHNPVDFLTRLNKAGIPNTVVTAEPSVKCGITGTHITVRVKGLDETSVHEHKHEHMHVHAHEHAHTHEHAHEHEHTHTHGHEHANEHTHTHEHAHEHEHTHTHGHEHANEHTHTHEHEHANEHTHSHEHEHSHEHTHTHEHEHANEHTYTHGHAHAHAHQHSHNDYQSIEALINRLQISDTAKKNAAAVYHLIADAESHVHGVPVNQIHFHEVGEMDAIADIVGVCMLIEELAPEKILASPVNTGSGQVRCAHGILPVPAPATAFILRGIPVYNSAVYNSPVYNSPAHNNQPDGELCTPTGAALLKHFVKEYGPLPLINIDALGYGMGTKDFEKANCVRAYWGNADGINKDVEELVCNLDDMTPEAIAFAQQLLLDEGALDVYTTPIGMKKGRTGFSFTCMCRLEDRDKMLSLLFKHTTTLGVRSYACRRYTLQKELSDVQTPYGKVSVKTSRGFGVVKSKAEYEDVADIARKRHTSISEIVNAVNMEIWK